MEHRRIKFTEAGHERRQHLLARIERTLDAELVERKSVPGIDVVEITGSDVEEVGRSMDVVFRSRYDQRRRSRTLIVNAYLVLGTLTAVAGLFYDRLKSILLESPEQLFVIVGGVMMVLAALFLRFSYASRAEAITRQQELLEALEEKARRIRELDA